VTNLAASYAIELLNAGHDRASFSSGAAALDIYFRERATQAVRRRAGVVYVLVHRQTRVAAGFYTLANTSIELSAIPPAIARKLPRYPLVPATLLGRLAVDLRHQKKGLGEFLLADAMKRTLKASKETASFALVVDAKDENATAFYVKFGFVGLPDTPRRLFLPLDTLQAAIPPENPAC